MPKNPIEVEVLEATKALQKGSENRQGFLKRVMRKAESLTDEQWGGLSTTAQRWVNQAVDAVEGKKPILDFGEMDEAPQEEPSAEEGTAAASEEAEEGAESEEVADDGEEEEDDESTAGVEDAPASEAEEAAAADPKPKKAKKAKREKEPKKEKKPKKESRSNNPGRDKIRELLLESPSLKKEELSAALSEAGVTMKSGVVSATRRHFLATLKFLRDKGLLVESEAC